jgi:uncharacterized damage-inducible protein DinB
MQTNELGRSLATLLNEIAYGASPRSGYVLNPGDGGFLAAIDQLPASTASAALSGGATIAAHVAHVTYGFRLWNRWAAGEDPWKDADWAAAWKIARVSDTEWEAIRAALRREVDRWLGRLREPREVSDADLNGIVGSVAHFAYHLGAIRQIAPAARGPRDSS